MATDGIAREHDRAGQDTALILLAAGQSKRFGELDKLGTDLNGLPLAHYILRALDGFAWAQRILVTSGDCAWHSAYLDRGFEQVENREPSRGMASSLALGTSRISGATSALICLADMPFVTSQHVALMLAKKALDQGDVIASRSANYIGPPVLISVDRLRDLPREGDQGARSIIAQADLVFGDDHLFLDVDDQQSYAKAAAQIAAGYSYI